MQWQGTKLPDRGPMVRVWAPGRSPCVQPPHLLQQVVPMRLVPGRLRVGGAQRPGRAGARSALTTPCGLQQLVLALPRPARPSPRGSCPWHQRFAGSSCAPSAAATGDQANPRNPLSTKQISKGQRAGLQSSSLSLAPPWLLPLASVLRWEFLRSICSHKSSSGDQTHSGGRQRAVQRAAHSPPLQPNLSAFAPP